MEDKGFSDSIKNMELSYNTLRASISDLTNCADAMEEYLKIVKNPLALVMDNDIGEKLDALNGKMQLYMAMASNKLDAYNQYCNGRKGE